MIDLTRIQALVITALIGAAFLLAAIGYGLWWRAEAYAARAERDKAVTQSAVLSASLKTCSAGVDALKKQGDRAISRSRRMLAEARKRNEPIVAQVARLEDLIAHAPERPGAGCDDAWGLIENNAPAGSQQ